MGLVIPYTRGSTSTIATEASKHIFTITIIVYFPLYWVQQSRVGTPGALKCTP